MIYNQVICKSGSGIEFGGGGGEKTLANEGIGGRWDNNHHLVSVMW